MAESIPNRMPAEHLGGGTYLVRPEAAAEVRNALVFYARDQQRRDAGGPPSLLMRTLIVQAAEAADAAMGVVALAASVDDVGPELDRDLVGAKEAAAIYGCSPRHVSRIPRLPCHQSDPGSPRMYERSEVEAAAARRRRRAA